MSRRILYMAHPVAPDMRRALAHWEPDEFRLWLDGEVVKNTNASLRWLAWLRKSFPEETFIAPWIAAILSLGGDGTPEQREAGLVDDCAVVERCDGIVLCGGRISNGMQRERDHGIAHAATGHGPPWTTFAVYDLTSMGSDTPLTVGPIGRGIDSFYRDWITDR